MFLTWRRSRFLLKSSKIKILISSGGTRTSNLTAPLLISKIRLFIPSSTTSYLMSDFRRSENENAMVNVLASDEIFHSIKHFPANYDCHEAFYNDIQLVFENTCPSTVLSVVLGITTNFKSFTFNLYQGTADYRTNADRDTALCHILNISSPFALKARSRLNWLPLICNKWPLAIGSSFVSMDFLQQRLKTRFVFLL